MKCEIYLGQALSGGNSPTEPGPRRNRSQSVNLRHLLILSAGLAIGLSFLLPRLAAASPGNDSETTHAPIRVMELDANYAYLGLVKNAHAEYVVFDIFHPEAPKIVDQAEVGQSVSAIYPSAIGTFIATESAERDIYLRTQEPASLQKIITLPGEGKIVKMDQLGEFLVILSRARDSGNNVFILDIKDPAAPRIHLESQHSEARIAHKLRIPPQIAKIPPLKVARLWQQHPGDANYAVVGLATDTDSFRVHRIEPETLRFRDNNGDGMLQLACVGDSNTVGNTNVWPSSWCHWVAEEVLNSSFTTKSYSVIGAGIESAWPDKAGATLLAKALEENPDAVVFALGSNDLPHLRPDHLAEDIRFRVSRLQALVAAAEETGAQTFVALLPPRFDRQHPAGARDLFNEAIRANWSPHEILDFDSGFDSSDFGSDGLHFTGIGHAKRALRAAEFLQENSAKRKTP
jgi:lysophospholipase L1-like esterase